MENNVLSIRQEYEDQITTLKRESENDSKEMAELKFIKLTTEIMESKSSLEKQSFSASAQIVENLIGTRSWKMLPENIQIYLTTAEQVYNVLKNQNEKSDYSLVGMELCKALETTLNQTLIEPFVKYINKNRSEFLRINKVAEKNKNPVYYTYLAKVVDQANYSEINSLTLGQYHFILKRTLEGDYALQEYAEFLDKIHAELGIVIEEKFLSNLTIVTKQYRNTITHKSSMNKKQCEHLRRLIFAGDDSLVQQLS